MFTTLLLSVAISFVDDGGKPPAVPAAADRSAYDALKKVTPKKGDAQIRLALWCEAHGLDSERLRHLTLATIYDPSNALARGLLGLIASGGDWKRPDDIAKTAQDDPAQKANLEEYLERRAKTPETADGHLKLALWCQQHNLPQPASAHFHQVITLDPSRETAWRHLGYKKVGGQWIKPEVVAAAKAAFNHQEHANRHWKPILERYRQSLMSNDAHRRATAEAALAQITDRDAIAMVWTILGKGKPPLQKIAVQILGQIDDAAASRYLTLLAVFGGSAEVRANAVATLRRRDAREFANILIGMILQPIEYEVKRVKGPGQGGELLIKGQGSAANLKRLYSPPAAPAIAPGPNDRLIYDQNGLPVVFRPEFVFSPFSGGVQLIDGQSGTIPIVAGQFSQPKLPTTQQKNQMMEMMSQKGFGVIGQKIGQSMLNAWESQVHQMNNSLSLGNSGGWQTKMGQMFGDTIPVGQMTVEAEKSAFIAEKQLETDVQTIKNYNESTRQINQSILPVLNDISGLDLGPYPDEWRKWFFDLTGDKVNMVQASDNPTVVENVPLAYQPQAVPIGAMTMPVVIRHHSCFAAGTMVRTTSGLRSIETLKVGDQVLSQNTKTGALAYKPLLAVQHNPPSTTFRIHLGDESIVTSGFHRFWKAGTGWVMAQDLKVGDPIRSLDGTIPISRIDKGEVVPVYNVTVADNADFFVANRGFLVHDFTLPNLRETAFDAIQPVGAPVAKTVSTP